MSNWYDVESNPPESGTLVECTTPGGDVRVLKRSGNMWFVPDGSVYVYFTPVKWRPLTEQERANLVGDMIAAERRRHQAKIEQLEQETR